MVRFPVNRRRFLASSTAAAAAAAAARFGQAGSDRAAPFRPRFSICNETFGDWPFDKAFAVAADAGYQGIEIAPFTISEYVTDVSAARRADVRRQAEQAGLRVVGLHWLLARTKGFHLTSPDEAVRRRTAEYLGELARCCRDLGGELLIFGSPQQRNLQEGVAYEQGLRYAADVLQRALPQLERHNVRLAMEPLSPRTTNFLTTAAQAVELIERVGSPRVQLILDCLAMSTESTPIPELIRRHGRRLIHFHANDPNRQGPGFGALDFLPIFQALRDVDYRGWISVEVFDYSPGPERLARESIRYMRRVVRRVGNE